MEKLVRTVDSLRRIWDAVGFGDAESGERFRAVYQHLAVGLDQMAHELDICLCHSPTSAFFVLLQLAEETIMRKELREKIELRSRDVHKLRLELGLPPFEVLLQMVTYCLFVL